MKIRRVRIVYITYNTQTRRIILSTLAHSIAREKNDPIPKREGVKSAGGEGGKNK